MVRPIQPRTKRVIPILVVFLAVFVTIVTRRGTPPKPANTPAPPAPARVEAQQQPQTTTTAVASRRAASPLDELSAEERAEVEKTLALIERGGPFPHRQDGTVFSNREGRLPKQPRGYYHEYTVETPGASTRGARRIVRGSKGETYYTNDHYESFIRIDS